MTKVLILDQSKSVRNILRERLEYEGFSAEAVENEAAASALCERIPFDVILSDTECKCIYRVNADYFGAEFIYPLTRTAIQTLNPSK